MYNYLDFLTVLQKAKQHGNLAIFVGAGISKTVEVKPPDWNALIEEMQKNIDYEERDPLKLAQLYYLKYGEVEYYNKIKSFFPEYYIKPSNIHKCIVDIQPNILITTNWDSILEYVIEDNMLLYDIIVSDSDLVKSSLPKKLIKMHGDFNNHNIVFKEDDYINYKYNFPLIENYIKSVLSTNVILFLGYSYSDIDIKQIIKWIQVHSKFKPPMYLVSHENNYTQQEYLKNHGITTVVLNYNDDNGHQVWRLYEEKLESLLKQIKDRESCDTDKVNYLAEKLSPLDSLDSVLSIDLYYILNSINDNSGGIIYTRVSKEQLPLLYLDENKFASFLATLTKIEQLSTIDEKRKAISKNKFNDIFTKLSKCNIGGIMLTQDDMKERYFSVVEDAGINMNLTVDISFNYNTDIYDKFGFSQRLKISLIFFQLGQFNSCINLIENIIKDAKKEHNYSTLFIAIFNYNWILNLTNPYKHNNQPKFINLKDTISQIFPPNTQQFEFFHRIFITHINLATFLIASEEELENIKARIKAVENGAIVLNGEKGVSETRLLNLVSFAEKNNLLVSEHEYFYKSIRVLLEAIFLKQENKEKILNRFQLFSLIKFTYSEKTKKLLFDNENKKRIILNICPADKEWLINEVLRNLKYPYSNMGDQSRIYRYIENLIIILSSIQWGKNQIAIIFEGLSEIILNSKTTLNIYININEFIGLQYNLFNIRITNKQTSRLINAMLNKLLFSKNMWDSLGITEYSTNIFNLNIDSEIIEDKSLINKLLLSLLDDSIDMWNMYRNILFLLSLHNISNSICRKEIETSVLSKIRLMGESEHLIDSGLPHLILKFILINMKLREPDDDEIEKLLNEADSIIKEMIGKKSFSGNIYGIDHQIKYAIQKQIVSKTQSEKLESISTSLDELILQKNVFNKNISNF